VLRALAVLDRRLGRRRLRTLEFRTDEHPLVIGLYRFRCTAEGIRLEAPVAHPMRGARQRATKQRGQKPGAESPEPS
jgi:hypothetical protein